MQKALQVLLAYHNVCLPVHYVDGHSVDVLEEDVPVLVLRIVAIECGTLVFFNHAWLARVRPSSDSSSINFVYHRISFNNSESAYQ